MMPVRTAAEWATAIVPGAKNHVVPGVEKDRMSMQPADGTSIRVISLASSQGRRTNFIANAKTRLTWSFFDAHEKLDPALAYDPIDVILALGTPMTAGELGCYSSHFAVWREFLASPHHQLLVLEDDVVVDWGYLEFLLGHDFEKMGIRYLRLFAKRPSSFRHVVTQFLEFNHDLIQFTGYVWGTQGYLLTRAGAEQFVQHLRRVRRKLDSQMDRTWVHGVANLAVFPFPIIEILGTSTIGDSRFEHRKQLPLKWKIRRLPHQIIERTGRIGWQLFPRVFKLKDVNQC
jgi:glycosyl transferase family 25